MIRKYLAVLLLTGFVFIMYSCGGNAPAPENATITITGDAGVSDGTSIALPHTARFVIVVKDGATSIPLGNVKLWITYMWSVPDSTGLVQLYDGDEAKDAPMEVTTDSEGAYYLRMDYQSGGGLVYSAGIIVTSGSVSSSFDFDVDAGGSS